MPLQSLLFVELKKYIKKVVVNEGITNVGAQIFKGCTNINEVILPEGLISIASGSFHGCSSLININFPNTLVSIGNYAFFATLIQEIIYNGTEEEWSLITFGTNNDAITISKVIMNEPEAEEIPLLEGSCGTDITFFLSQDGTLTLSGSGSTYNYHSQKTAPWWDLREQITSVIINEGITTLGTQLFRKCIYLAEASLPTSLTKIDGNVFIGCQGLKEITIPEAVTYIGRYAFNSSGIQLTTYLGTPNEWKAIEIGEYNVPLLANVVYAKEDPVTEEIIEEIPEETTENIESEVIIEETEATEITTE